MNFTKFFYGKNRDFSNPIRKFVVLNGNEENIITALPIDSQRVLDAAFVQLGLTKGSRLKPKLIITILRLLNIPALYFLIFRKQLCLKIGGSENLLTFLSKKLSISSEHLLFSIYKSPGKFVLPLFDSRAGNVLGYAKICDMEARERGENEARALRYLANFSFETAEPPRLIFSGYWDNYLVNIISTKEGLKSSKGVTNTHIKWIKELAIKTGRRIKFEDSRFAKEIEVNFDEIRNSVPRQNKFSTKQTKMREEDFEIVEYFYNKSITALRDKELIFSFINREFDYYELLSHPIKSLVIDWEHAEKEFPPLFDVFNVFWSESDKKGKNYVEEHINGLEGSFFKKNRRVGKVLREVLND